MQFKDGSYCNIGGSLRVTLPNDPDKALALVTQGNYKTYDQLEHELIFKITRNALMLTANLMTPQESYAEKRPDFVFWAWDQIEHGQYETAEETTDLVDPITKELVRKTIKVIKKGPDGKPVRQKNQLEGLGITLGNFEIKEYDYDEEVKKQIAEQQVALMGVATARAKAAQAEQENITEEAKGESRVTKAKYEEMEKKARAVVQAEQEKEVAETKAEQEKAVAILMKEKAETEGNQRLEVAKLDRKAAEETKLKDIALGEGEAQRKRLVMEADGALREKLDVYLESQKAWAEAVARHQGNWVPQVVMASGTQASPGGTASGYGAQTLIDLLATKAAKDLALDFSFKGQPSPQPTNGK